MSDSIFSLVAVQRGLVPTVQPIIPTFFEPLSPPVIPLDETLSRPVETHSTSDESATFLSQPQPYRGNLNPIQPHNLITLPSDVAQQSHSPQSDSPAISSSERLVDSTPSVNPAAISGENENPTAAVPRITVIEQHGWNRAHTVEPTFPDNQAPRSDNSELNAPAPIVHIRIGQIYVRAMPSAPSRQTRTAKPPAPKESLDDYLNARDRKKS